MAVQRYLNDHGFRCSAFASADSALRALAGPTQPSAVVTDIMMPGGMDGLDLLRTLRADARLCAVPVVLLTARGTAADRITGYEAGASAYVTKPFDPEELVAVLRSLTMNAVLARSAAVGDEVAELRREVSSMRQLLQAMLQLQSGGRAPSPHNGVPRALGAPPDKRYEPLVATSSSSVDGGGGASAASAPKLTRRERMVLELVSEGMLNKEIAARLGVGKNYVEKVITRLLEKTGTFNRTSLVRRALQIGLISLDGGGMAQTVEGAKAVFVTQPPTPAQGGQLPPGRTDDSPDAE